LTLQVTCKPDVVDLEVLDEISDARRRCELFAQCRHLRRGGLDVEFLQVVDAPITEERGFGVEVLLDLERRRFGRRRAHALDDRTRQDLALAGLDLLHDLRVAVELERMRFAQQQLLVDQAFENHLARRTSVFRAQPPLLLQREVDLVNRDLVLVDAGRCLAPRGVGLRAAPGQHGEPDAHCHGAKPPRAAARGVGLLRHPVSCNSRPSMGSVSGPAAKAVAGSRRNFVTDVKPLSC